MSNNNQYCPTNILVNGGAGFIGSNFVHYWLKKYPNAPVCLGKKARELITYVKDRLGHDHHYAIDPTKSNSELGYKPDESFVTGIDKTIKWHLDNEDWWRHIMSGEYQDWINQQYEK